ncbi:MAG: universal stress protein [Deltaproteobacteria bacterium]|nr:universal stress protein [Deltaproteobacteria bacterium]RLB96522.1 MAG: universal stress protein [Deltaproteobacteria bacterium]
MYKKIMIPVDGSEPSDRAVQHGVVLAEKFGARVLIMNVIQPVSFQMPESFLYADQLMEQLTAQGVDIVEGYKKKFQEADLDIQAETLVGLAADVICEKAEAEHFDLVVIGSRGLSPGIGFLLGSVSGRVSRRCPCPVLIVR